jgi:hypothetical protein
LRESLHDEPMVKDDEERRMQRSAAFPEKLPFLTWQRSGQKPSSEDGSEIPVSGV